MNMLFTVRFYFDRTIVLDYRIYPGSNKLWPKDESMTVDVPNCCFQPMWKANIHGKSISTCLLRGRVMYRS